MNGIISSYRRSIKRVQHNQAVIVVEGVTSAEKAKALVGKTATWTSPGKERKKIAGKITGTHGRNGSVRALFERGLPGQSLGTAVMVE